MDPKIGYLVVMELSRGVGDADRPRSTDRATDEPADVLPERARHPFMNSQLGERIRHHVRALRSRLSRPANET